MADPSERPPDRPVTTSTHSTPRRAREWRPRFLAALRNSSNVRAACGAAGIDWSTAYKARKRDRTFAQAWDMAEQEALDLLEGRAFQLALAGDPRLIMFFLKTRRPEKFRETVRIDVRREAERIAAELGVSAAETIAETARIVAATSR